MNGGEYPTSIETALPDDVADFPSPCAARGGGRPSTSVIVLADRTYVRAEIAEDVAAAGIVSIQARSLSEAISSHFTEGLSSVAFADIVVVDCPVASHEHITLIQEIDRNVNLLGTQFIVSTSINSLDEVFGSVTQSDAQILVTPTRADRIMALGRSLVHTGNKVRELSEGDRLAIMRLTEQVAQIAQKIEKLSGDSGERSQQPSPFNFDGANSRDMPYDGNDRLIRSVRPALPDPRLVRRIIRHRQLRERYFEGDLFADPAWDMLLDLTAARVENTRVSVTSLCIASGVPPTTALRWIGQMTDAGLLERVDDVDDRRRAFLTLTERAAMAMARYFAEMAASAGNVI